MNVGPYESDVHWKGEGSLFANGTHTLSLGTLPKSQKWAAVVAVVRGAGEGVGTALLSQDVDGVARQTLQAAEAGIERAIGDAGLQHTFYVLTQLVLAARQTDWERRLGLLGVHLGPDSTLFDLTVEVQAAIDDHIARLGRPTDISEMAQQAAGDALARLAGPKATTLFGETANDLRLAVRELSTKNGFAELGQSFFGQFIARFLNFYLSRATASDLGGDRLHQVGDLSSFNSALATHCYQSARIVRDFCGEWYSSTEFREGISTENTSRFMAVAIKKLQAEMRHELHYLDVAARFHAYSFGNQLLIASQMPSATRVSRRMSADTLEAALRATAWGLLSRE